MSIIKFIAEPVFDLSLFINAALYIIQIIKLIQTKTAANLSLSTFILFFWILLIQALQAFYLNDFGYFIGMLFSLLTSGILIGLVIYYRIKEDNRQII